LGRGWVKKRWEREGREEEDIRGGTAEATWRE
jgi:hypothetical protein